MVKTIKKTCDNLNVVLAKANDFNSIEMVEAVKRTCNGPFQRIYNKVFKPGSESKNSEIEFDDLDSSNSSVDSSDYDE